MRTVKIVIAVCIVVAAAAGAFLVYARDRNGIALPKFVSRNEQNRVVGTLDKLDMKAGTLRLRLEDGTTKTFRIGKNTYFLIDGRPTSARSLRVGENASILTTSGASSPVDYVMQGAWQCPPGGKLPRLDNPNDLQCNPNEGEKNISP